MLEPRAEMAFTGERYTPTVQDPSISYEHWHRYLYASQFCAGKRVLDLACGEGYGTALLAGVASSIVGVDADEGTVSHAARKYAREGIEFRHGRAEAVPISEDHSFDVIVCLETIEHLESEAQQAFGYEAKRLLNAQGMLIFSTPNKALYSDQTGYVNPFHRHEFYENEAAAYARQFFAHVQLLGQKVYPASFIWQHPPVSENGFVEYQLSLSNGEFSPAPVDAKQRQYLLVICSDWPSAAHPASFLLDVTESSSLQQPEASVASTEPMIDSSPPVAGDQFETAMPGAEPSPIVAEDAAPPSPPAPALEENLP